MIIGAHSIIYSTDPDPDADRSFLKDVLKFPNVDVGGGWLISLCLEAEPWVFIKHFMPVLPSSRCIYLQGQARY